MNLATLKTELDTDPLSRGYSGMTDVEVADSLNTVNREADRTSMSGGLLVSALVRSEYVALNAQDRMYVQVCAAAGEIPLTQNIKTELGAVFGGGTTTRANLLALMKRPGSRGEELGIGRVTPSDVAAARALA